MKRTVGILERRRWRRRVSAPGSSCRAESASPEATRTEASSTTPLTPFISLLHPFSPCVRFQLSGAGDEERASDAGKMMVIPVHVGKLMDLNHFPWGSHAPDSFRISKDIYLSVHDLGEFRFHCPNF